MSASPNAGPLAALRDRIDRIDSAMVELLAERIRTVEEVVEVKQAHGLAARLDDRVEAVVANVRKLATERNCPPDLAEHVWRAMIEWVIAFEEPHLAGSTSRHPE